MPTMPISRLNQRRHRTPSWRWLFWTLSNGAIGPGGHYLPCGTWRRCGVRLCRSTRTAESNWDFLCLQTFTMLYLLLPVLNSWWKPVEKWKQQHKCLGQEHAATQFWHRPFCFEVWWVYQSEHIPISRREEMTWHDACGKPWACGRNFHLKTTTVHTQSKLDPGAESLH